MVLDLAVVEGATAAEGSAALWDRALPAPDADPAGDRAAAALRAMPDGERIDTVVLACTHFPLLEAAGATDINGTTDYDRSNYFETVPSNQLELALWIESDRMGYLLDTVDQAVMPSRFTRFGNLLELCALALPNGFTAEIAKFYYDLAGASNKGAIASLLTLVRPTQILFGTDFPPGGTAAEYAKTLAELGLFSAADLKAIDRDNAVRLIPRLGA